jgi:hypothetical protein
MKRNSKWNHRFALAFFALVVLVTLMQWVRAQGSGRNTPVHMTTDWSNHHVLFSQPHSLVQSMRLASEPRYGHQWLRRNPGVLLQKGFVPLSNPVRNQSSQLQQNSGQVQQRGSVPQPDSILSDTGPVQQRGSVPQTDAIRNDIRPIRPGGPFKPYLPPLNVSDVQPVRTDWGMSLSANGTVGVEMFPAKFDFDITKPPDCAKDYVVFNTSLAGGAAQASIIAFNELYSTQGGAGGMCGSSGPSVMWAYNTGTGSVVTSPVISGDGTKVAYVESVGAGGVGSILHILQFKTGEGTGIITPHAAPTTLAGAWSTCAAGTSCIANITFNGTVASTDSNSSPFYNYNTDTLYVGDNNGFLHKFTGVFLGTPTEVSSSFWPVDVNGTAGLSSPVMDNVSVNIFVGDNTGALSYVKEVGSTTGSCSGGGNATPCLGLSLGASSGAVTTINVTIGATPTSNGTSPSGAVTDGPIVDGTAQVVFVTNGTETGGNNGTLIETNTALGSSTVGQVIANIGIGGNSAGGTPIHSGAFDQAYLNSVDGTGHLYVCGKDPNGNSRPAIFKLNINAGILNTNLTGTIMLGLTDTSTEDCSPVTEIVNPNVTGGPKEWIFFSFGNNANINQSFPPDVIPASSPCFTDNAGCLVSIDITSGVWPPALVTNTVSLPANPGGASTSGIIVDNIASPVGSPQASSIYFSLTVNSASGTGNPSLPQCNGVNGLGCAVKLTQADLQ